MPVVRLSDYLFPQVDLLQPCDNALAGQHPVDKQCDKHADTGVNNTVERVRNVGLNGGVEKQYAQHNSAGLNRAGPVENLADEDKQHHAHEQEREQYGVHSAVGHDHHIQSEKSHAEEAAEQGAEETVAAVETGIGHIAAQTENRADAGEGGIAAHDKVQKCGEGRGNCGLYVALTDVHVKVYLGQSHTFVPLCIVMLNARKIAGTDTYYIKNFLSDNRFNQYSTKTFSAIHTGTHGVVKYV